MEGIIKSSYSNIRVPEATSLSQFVLDRVGKHGDKLAFIDSEDGRTMTFNELQRSFRYLRCGLYKHNVVKDDVVFIILPTCMEYPIIFHSVLSLGGTITSCSPSASTDEISRQVLNSGACHVFTTSAHVGKIREAVPMDHYMKNCFVIGRADGCISYEDLLKDDASEYPVTIMNVRKDIAFLPYSSGTTGCPKPVKLTHYSMVYHMCQLMHPDLDFLSKGDTILCVLTMSHVFVTIVFLNMALITGCTTVIIPTRDMDAYIRAVSKYKATALHLIPPAIKHLIDKREEDVITTWPSVHTVFSTASILQPDLQEELRPVLSPGAKVREIFGLTECGVVFMSPVTGSPVGSVGTLIPNVSARVIHQEDGHACGPGEAGELLVKGHQTMSGYLNRPEISSLAITEDGWVHTGDLVKYDEDNYFYYIDRLKDIIRFEGLQVSPAELECLLKRHPGVKDAAVIGVPTDVVGEVPKAFVVKKEDSVVTEEELVQVIETTLASAKHLRGGLEFIDTIPTLCSGKVLRHRLREKEIEKRNVKQIREEKRARSRDTENEMLTEMTVTDEDSGQNTLGDKQNLGVPVQPPKKRVKHNCFY